MNKLLLILFLLLPFKSLSQEYITSSDFHWKIRRDITVVEFWAGWNRGNEILFLHELENCAAYRHVVCRDKKMMEEFNVTAAPTIIIFKHGEEKARFSPNIMLKVTATKKEVQSIIDSL